MFLFYERRKSPFHNSQLPVLLSEIITFSNFLYSLPEIFFASASTAAHWEVYECAAGSTPVEEERKQDGQAKRLRMQIQQMFQPTLKHLLWGSEAALALQTCPKLSDIDYSWDASHSKKQPWAKMAPFN
jgi:hypothetical protein